MNVILFCSLEHQIKVMEARNELVTSLEVCNKKKAWMEFEDLYIKHQELQSDLKKANEYVGHDLCYQTVF